MKYGDDLKITCLINNPNDTVNADQLFFIRNGVELDPSFTKIINNSAVELTVKKPPQSKDMYYCKLRTAANKEPVFVCANQVAVGGKLINNI